jgi:RNA polymerase sigma-70 factor, ECF subfamily
MKRSATDAEVIGLVLGGDIEAFGVLVDRYQDEFAAYATLMIGSPDDASDVIQESLVRAYRALRRCRDRDNFKSWLFRIVSNQCKTHLARRTRRAARPLEDAGGVPALDVTDQHVERGDLRLAITRALNTLPGDQREVLILKYVNELALDEIAPMLALSIPALKMRLLRARRALLTQLEGVLT